MQMVYPRGCHPQEYEERSIMYARNTHSWLKHCDFILLDILCLHASFLLAFMTRHGISNPYADREYLNLAVIYTLVDLLVLIGSRTMQDVLRRGFYKEMEHTVRHVFYVTVLVSLYLFSIQAGNIYSRITFFLLSGYYVLLTYGVRVGWKKILLKRKHDAFCSAVYFMTTRDRAEYVVERFREKNISSTKIQGMCILDDDCTGTTVGGVEVTATAETVVGHLCESWVDEVFVSLPAATPLPEKILSAMAEMGMVVHLEMEDLAASSWQHQVIEEFAGVTVRTISMTMATPLQAVLKRALDILGGIVGCLITGLLILIIGPMIYLKSPGPIFFKQSRVGKRGKKFQIYKFRSMYLDAEERKAELMDQNRVQGGLMFKMEYDPRIIGCEKRPDGIVAEGTYYFSEEGRMYGIKLVDGQQVLGEIVDGVYYEAGKPVQAGLIELDGSYYFAGNDGKLSTGKYYVWKPNGIVAEGTYYFSEEGRMYGIKLVDGQQVLGEFVDGIYYEAGKPVQAGLIEWNGSFVYVGASGKLITGKSYIWKTNGIVAEGTYWFDEGTGSMYGRKVVDGQLVIGEIVDGVYYENGKPVQAGLIELDGYYYFAGTDGKIATGKTYVWKTNGITSEGHCYFDENGRMFGLKVVDGQQVVGQIAEFEGELYYYENGKGVTAGLLYIDGYYYFANTNGKLIVNQRYYVWKTNGLLLETHYTFNELGQIVG